MKLFQLLIFVSTSLMLINADEFVHTLTSKNFDTFISEHSNVLVTFYAPWCAHSKPLLPEFKKAAETLFLHTYNDVVLAKVDVMVEKDLATKYQIKAYPTLEFFTGDVSNPIDYYGGRTEATIIKWISSQISVQEISPIIHRYRQDVDYDLPLLWISIDGAKQNEKQSIISNLIPFARETQDKLSFIWFDTREISDARLQKLGITQTPGILIESAKKKWFRVYSSAYNEKYLFDGNIFDTDQLKEFFTSYLAGKLTPYIQSQPVPETNNETVYILVGSTFEDVIGKDKDVLVFFYASWHGHSKQFAPEYEKVGEAFKDNHSIVIAKINAAENDTPQPVQGLPMLFYYPAGSNNGIRYWLRREHKSVIKWIKQHMSQQHEEQCKYCVCEEQQDRISMLESELSACKEEQNKKIDSLQLALLNIEKQYSELQIENNELKQENRYLKINNVNMNEYKQWTEQEILFWIISLNDGQFSKYKDILSKSLKEESVTGRDLHDVEPNDIKRWGISTFNDIKAIYKQIQRLTSNNQSIRNHHVSKEEI